MKLKTRLAQEWREQRMIRDWHRATARSTSWKNWVQAERFIWRKWGMYSGPVIPGDGELTAKRWRWMAALPEDA